MPKTRVSPAASRNSSSPNCRPFRHCSRNSSMGLRSQRTDVGRRADGLASSVFRPLSSLVRRPASPLHRALLVEAVLAVLDDRGHGLEDEIAARILDRFLQVEILDGELIVAVLVG